MMILYILCVSCCGICIHLKGGVLYCVEKKKRFILICTYIYFFIFFHLLLLCYVYGKLFVIDFTGTSSRILKFGKNVNNV